MIKTPTKSSNAQHAFVRPGFIVIVLVLLVAALTFNTAAERLKLHFKKEAVAQPRDFHEIAPVLGHWMQATQDEKLDKEVQDVLGTDKYVYRDFINVDRCGADFIEALNSNGNPNDTTHDKQNAVVRNRFVDASFAQRVAMINDALKGKSAIIRRKAVDIVQARHADAVVNMGLTYYTGLVDTVAHIPDRCYIADGYEPKDYTQPTWQLAGSNGKSMPMEVRLINFEDQTLNHRVPKTVAYVFQVNGQYTSDPLEVRKTLQSLTQKYGYYAKIELMTVGADVDGSAAAMTDFLSSARPQIETCFPDWAKVNQLDSPATK